MQITRYGLVAKGDLSGGIFSLLVSIVLGLQRVGKRVMGLKELCTHNLFKSLLTTGW